MTEADLQGAIMDLARLYGWRAAHFRPSLTQSGRWATAMSGETGASLTAAGWVRVRDIPPRKGWADSSVALRALRDPIGAGGVQRTLWEMTSA